MAANHNRGDYGIGVIMRVYAPDLERYKTWTPPNAERVVVKPDIGPDWQFRMQIQTLLPTSMFRGGKK